MAKKDLMHSDAIKSLVRNAYLAVLDDKTEMAARLYSDEELARVPKISVEHSFGVGNHLGNAEMRPGEVVLDLGCGAGIDTILAAQAVGPEGSVIGLDFLPEMLSITESAAREAGLDNISTVEGAMESIPLLDNSVDLIISNGVVNLSPRKARVLAECARVLRPGGRICLADLVMEGQQLPPEVLVHPAAWAGCVAGVLTINAFEEKLLRFGFQQVQVVHRRPFGIHDCATYPLFTDELISLMEKLIPEEGHNDIVTQIVITGRLPAVGSEGAEHSAAPIDKAPAPSHFFDAGNMGCSDGLPREFRRRISEIPHGDRLTAVLRDPSAKEDLPSLARLLGHTVESVESDDTGRARITVRRGPS